MCESSIREYIEQHPEIFPPIEVIGGSTFTNWKINVIHNYQQPNITPENKEIIGGFLEGIGMIPSLL